MKRLAFLISLFIMLAFTTLSNAQDPLTPIDFSGTVDAMGDSTITVGGLTVDISTLDADVIAQLETGMTVTISGNLDGTIVIATIVVLPETEVTATPPPDDDNDDQGEDDDDDDDDDDGTALILTDANYTVVFDGSNYDGTQTTFTYTVTGMGTSPALSHFDIEIPQCTPDLELSGFTPTEAVELGEDPSTGVDGIKWDLSLGESESRTYTLTFLGFVAEGDVSTAVKNGNGFFTITVIGPSCSQPSVDIEKYISADGGTWTDADSAPGIEIAEGGNASYRLVVTNDGNVPLTEIALSDTQMDVSGCSIPAEMMPEDVFECLPGSMPATEAQLSNTATVTATGGDTSVTDSDSANYFTGDLPSINLEKQIAVGDPSGWIDADSAPGAEAQEGNQVYYRLVVTNDGNVPLTAISVSDAGADVSSCSFPAELEPEGTADCVVGPFTAVANQYTNTATVTATGGDISVTDTDSANYFGLIEPVTSGSFTITFLGSVYANGQTTFSYGVVGNGTPPDLSHFDIEIPTCEVPLEVVVYSPTDAVSFGIDPTTNINGIKWDLPLLSTSDRNYSITFNGYVALGNVTVAVKAGNGFDPVTVPGPACDVAQINLQKFVSVDGGASWSDANSAPGPDAELDSTVLYRLRVRNDGNSPVTGITLVDDSVDLSGCTIPEELDVDAFFECDSVAIPVVAGQQVNTATARAVLGDGYGATTDTDKAYYFGGDRPELTVEGYVSSNGGATWNDADSAPGLLVEPDIEVSFRYEVTNTGNVDLEGITLSGTLGDASACEIPAILEPDMSFTCDAGSMPSGEGQQVDRVTASVTYNDLAVEDTDPSYFFGGEIDDDTQIIIVIEGPVSQINGNIITIFGYNIIVDEGDPRLTVIQIGDIIRVQGNDRGGILIAIVFVFTDIEIFINGDDVWRDSGTCGNAPPPWAPAWGWRARCEGGGVNVIIVSGSGGSINVPSGCKLTGRGNGNIRLKCSRGSRGSRRSS